MSYEQHTCKDCVLIMDVSTRRCRSQKVLNFKEFKIEFCYVGRYRYGLMIYVDLNSKISFLSMLCVVFYL